MSSESFPEKPAAREGTGQQVRQREMVKLTDAKAMRALAHPLRMALLELFSASETLTATQASEVLGESPANCAFHLRTLAKYGFIEEAGGGRGRERPWKAAQDGFRVSSTQDNEQARMAADALGEVWIDRWFARVKQAAADKHWPAEWDGAVGSDFTTVFLTPAELQAVREQMHAILREYLDRREEPSLRPAGSLPVELSAFAYPRKDLALLLSLNDADDAGDADQNPGESS